MYNYSLSSLTIEESMVSPTFNQEKGEFMEMAIWVRTEDLPEFLAGKATLVNIHTPASGNHIRILCDPAKEVKFDFSNEGQTVQLLRRK
ncbi:hypothetical protein A2Y83_03460 [Candidatus Falkowbacteria bacterium RBG_13_39_14]|uniref:Uncharacterized protein n=1 Tax=Candidatus Falkowbacteria bacterium RBG_13_39_14 TaxID=1797985 RepID=A0A1F5S271_9BACT|nr:MAG: hypothetical protein A2Y83_03460 [Candidatus Falkowbacteria bacterium RBG_13_39_14]